MGVPCVLSNQKKTHTHTDFIIIKQNKITENGIYLYYLNKSDLNCARKIGLGRTRTNRFLNGLATLVISKFFKFRSWKMSLKWPKANV